MVSGGNLQRKGRRCIEGCLTHDVRFFFQDGVVVDGDRFFQLCRCLYPTLPLLHDMPGFVRKMLFLAGAKMDIVALRIGQGVKLGGLGRIEVDADIGEVHSGEVFHSGLELVRHAGLVGFGFELRRPGLVDYA